MEKLLCIKSSSKESQISICRPNNFSDLGNRFATVKLSQIILKRSDNEGVMRSRNASATFDRRAEYTGSGRRAGGLRGIGGIGLLLFPYVMRVVEFGDEGADTGRFGPLVAGDE